MKVLETFAILSPQQVEEGLGILKLLYGVSPGFVNLFMKSSHLSRQVGIGFCQLLNLTGGTFKLAHLGLLGINFPH